MKDDPLPSGDHVSHYCSAHFLDEDGRPAQTAFYLKKGEDCVSVNWLEYTGLPTRSRQLDAVRKALIEKGLTIRKSGKLAVLRVGDVTSIELSDKKQRISVSHQPEPPHDPSHSGIFYPSADQALVEFIATRVAERVLEAPTAIPSE
jgi:hypothetical protein